ncbi:ribosomal protein S18 acetylase RimI-like enzyme [Frondihabitans sp. PhB188]|uniref:GNAT family N-acetyltransferase n=1 Tax=Frondihabitans sp. PhB188 TaxID=2485200 RepID=UPI000F47B735|nr:GNAT family N-acetyltransferase [Frondihabitans sp. PhB188]ROQ38189.1 ribosomal protein S18 acetylase RimI-like enzyme [Frondihabitans sp. PhB188]
MTEYRALAVDDPEAHALLAAYFDERIATFPDPVGYTTTFPEPAAFVPPAGVFLVADVEGASGVACGGIRRISDDPDGGVRYEVKHLYVGPDGRGRGLGKAFLAELERRARGFGADWAVLDTNASLTAAGGLYRSTGYEDVEPYNDNPNATNWYRKPLR